ncbi:MAG: ribonuclease HII [Rhodobacteraceae bacterium]|nr:ribonuclease HII [Paracoccaceae bacterium]
MARHWPNDSIERELRTLGHRCIAGVDEAGRGALAGPVVAAAVVLDLSAVPDGLNDSKQLSERVRASMSVSIRDCAQVAFAAVDARTIERINILEATMEAMKSACEQLPQVPDFALVDGNRLPLELCCPARAVIRGDAKSVSIAAASIVAKVERDRIMAELAVACPGYGWAQNKGYGTPAHRQALSEFGVTRHHRRTFAPVGLFDLRNRLSGTPLEAVSSAEHGDKEKRP